MTRRFLHTHQAVSCAVLERHCSERASVPTEASPAAQTQNRLGVARTMIVVQFPGCLALVGTYICSALFTYIAAATRALT